MPVPGTLPGRRTPPVCLTATCLQCSPPCVLHSRPSPNPSPVPSSVLSRMLRTSASSKDSSSGCWATYGWTHWICGQSAGKEGESEAWSGTEPAVGQHGSGEYRTTSSDLVRNPTEAKGCPSHRDWGSISRGKGAGSTSPPQCPVSSSGGRRSAGAAQPRLEGSKVRAGPRDKWGSMVETRGAQGEGVAEAPGLALD